LEDSTVKIYGVKGCSKGVEGSSRAVSNFSFYLQGSETRKYSSG
jgi:hypothetical protein